MQAFQTATELPRALRAKRVSSRELTDLYIRRIEKYDPGIKAVVVRDFERAPHSTASGSRTWRATSQWKATRPGP